MNGGKHESWIEERPNYCQNLTESQQGAHSDCGRTKAIKKNSLYRWSGEGGSG